MNPTAPTQNPMTPDARRDAQIRAFVRDNFSVRGTLLLHRSAFGADLLRAPANVLLAPVLIIVRLMGVLAKAIGLRRIAFWLSRRKVLLQTNVSRQVALRVSGLVHALDAQGIGVAAPRETLDHEIAEYTGVRNAVGEITTMVLVMIAGFVLFRTATPGLFSLIGPVAERRAHSFAIEQFPLGDRLGGAYYAVFSPNLDIWQVVLTGVALAMMLSLVTSFAGVIADPIQVMTGTHRRRLSRLLKRLDAGADHSAGLPREHITARFGDLGDMALNLWRFMRG